MAGDDSLELALLEACLEHLHGHAERVPFRKAMAKCLGSTVACISIRLYQIVSDRITVQYPVISSALGKEIRGT